MTLTSLPEHAQEHLLHLTLFANEMAGYYQQPVYLVGSALIDSNIHPRDWDVRVMLPEEDFTRLYGDPHEWDTGIATGNWRDVNWRWSADCSKSSKRGWARTGLNIDFQVYPAEYAERAFGRYPRYCLANPQWGRQSRAAFEEAMSNTLTR